VGKNRTCWDLSLTLGIPFSRWGAHPFVVHPLPFPTHILEDIAPATKGRSHAQEPRTHPLLLAQSWRQEMEDDTKLNKARIAAREGISRASVTQVMNLLQLPTEIQAGLLRPPAPLEIHSFSERRLRVLVSCGDEEAQTARWRELVQELKSAAGN
jgi:ParB-like chromosome segregation protein Spo0J